MKMSLTKLLNLPGVIVEDSKQIKETLILSVKAENKTAVCPCAVKPVIAFIKIKDIELEIYRWVTGK